jgi:hypothetical protein
MPVKIGKKRYKSFAGAKKAAARKGIRNPAAYVAAIERAQGRDPRTGKKIKRVPTSKQRKSRTRRKKR